MSWFLWFDYTIKTVQISFKSIIFNYDFYDYWQLLRPEEVEILVCGSPELDMHALQRSTQYDGYAKTDPTIRWAPSSSDAAVIGVGFLYNLEFSSHLS